MKRFQNKYSIILGVHGRIPYILQVLIWALAEEMTEPDYLQIFELLGIEDCVLICHRQEVPPYENVMKAHCPVESGFKVKFYIINDVTHSTMLLAEDIKRRKRSWKKCG